MPLIIPYSFGTAGLNTPTTQLDGNNTAIANWINARTPTSGNFAARPAAGNVGAMYSAVDQNNQLYLDTGTAWVAVSAIQAPSPYATLAGQATPPPTPVSPNLIVYVGTAPGADLTILDEQGVSRTIDSTLFRAVAPGTSLSTISNTTAATSIFPTKPVIKAHTLTPNRALRVIWWHTIYNMSGANHNYEAQCWLGGTRLATIDLNQAGVTWPSTTNFQAVHTDFLLSSYGSGSAGLLECFTRMWYSTALLGVLGPQAAVAQVIVQESGQIAFNPEIDNTLDIQVLFDVASTSLIDTTQMVLGELL
jgi:hypothetical protein